MTKQTREMIAPGCVAAIAALMLFIGGFGVALGFGVAWVMVTGAVPVLGFACAYFYEIGKGAGLDVWREYIKKEPEL